VKKKKKNEKKKPPADLEKLVRRKAKLFCAFYDFCVSWRTKASC